ncbi:MAG TPA: SDR family NAD(P)-dependent oxidoreductase [Candidatus Dormibacteraeota bacterium]|nr:SDR family NAD(P)-dependent oxidoreductase [Candidatus Dormibacteraeota bacterium]
MEDLRGKTVLLTGASAGLGPHIARRLHRAGAKFVLSARSGPALRKLAKELGGSRVVVADLSLPGEPERLARAAGRVDVLVSNAGLPASGALTSYTIAQLDRALTVNLRAGIVLARELAPAMIKRKSGHLVFMSSVAGKVPTAAATLYHATKFGLRGFGLALREELWGSGVGVSVIYPTFVSKVGMWAETGLKVNPMAGEVSPEQVAEAVWSAITKNRGEVDVVPFQVRAGVVAQALAPGLFTSIARSTGATRAIDDLTERQRSKR